MCRKIILFTLTVILLVMEVKIYKVSASESQMFTESETETILNDTETKISSTSSSDMEFKVVIPSSFNLVIPKSINLKREKNTLTGEYEVIMKSCDIAPSQKVVLSAAETITLSENTSNKKIMVENQLTSETFTGYNDTCDIRKGILKADNVTAGDYSGVLQFNVSLVNINTNETINKDTVSSDIK